MLNIRIFDKNENKAEETVIRTRQDSVIIHLGTKRYTITRPMPGTIHIDVEQLGQLSDTQKIADVIRSGSLLDHIK